MSDVRFAEDPNFLTGDREKVSYLVDASFTVEDFSLKRLTLLKPSDIAKRYAALHELIRVEP